MHLYTLALFRRIVLDWFIGIRASSSAKGESTPATVFPTTFSGSRISNILQAAGFTDKISSSKFRMTTPMGEALISKSRK